ncbi:MAG: glycine cleavage system aminomethyltransferase GcvT [SAR86 cluster bacterium]|uniref:aminomethyltransferase n=1 Tax=SAR86 cluster bacterium TaxID=2030880 RepID=A0A937JBE7_9GAMM|nr:glycine cleavage system aminomethyltransferase GcvT [SAR86 cluster bacterium]
MNKTTLFEQHKNLGAKMVDFGGWSMPINYGSQINEHKVVRSDVGIFDVSHMSIFDLSGSEQEEFLKYLLPNNVNKIKNSGRALYSPLLNNDGGILDDLIVYNLGTHYRIISNCATRSQNHDWFLKQSKNYDVKIKLMSDLSIVAIQGPNSENILEKIGIYNLNTMSDFDVKIYNSSMIAKTGYTGEEGFEVVIDNSDVESFWMDLLGAGASPIGLGARDTLRLEAGLNLYGSDMDINNNPYESNLAWTIDLNDKNRDFIGKIALEDIKKDTYKELKGVILRDKGILRSHQLVEHKAGNGEILSGSYSPSFGFSIAFARLDKGHNGEGRVKIRNNEFKVEIVSPPFMRKGKMLI